MQRIMRGARVAAAVVCSLATMAGMSACGRTEGGDTKDNDSAVSSIDSKPAKGDLTLWAMGAEGEKLPELVKDFEKENPDVHVKVTSIPWASAHDKFQTAIAAGNGPDLAQMANTWMADFGNAFSTVPSNLSMDDMASGPVEGGKVGGKQLGVPWYIDTRVLYYRTDLAQQAGWDHAPKTWDELSAMGKDMKKLDGTDFGLYLNPAGTDNFIADLPFAFSAGASLTDESGKKWTLNTPEMRKAITYTSNLFKDGIADVNADTSAGANMAAFASGKTPMMMEGPTAIGQVEQVGGPDMKNKFTTAPLPKGEKGSVSYSGGCDMVVFKDSKNKDAAWKMIKWMSKPETQAKWYKLSTDLPASSKAWEDPELKNDEKLTAFATQMKSMKATPSVTTWAQVSASGDKIMEQINKGAISVDKGLEQLQSEAESAGMGN